MEHFFVLNELQNFELLVNNWVIVFYIYIYKGKVIPLQAQCGLEGG